MRCACIDIGSNTTRLLVGECDGTALHVVHEERAFTGLGHELAGADTISGAKRAELTAVVAAQLRTARRHGAGDVRGVATAAIRRAANGIELVRALQSETGLTVRVLSDREEARLAFVGAAGMLEHCPAGALGVLDVGGGSSELIVGDPPRTVAWWVSVPVGSGTLAARWLASDPPSPRELAAARGDVAAALARVEPPRTQRTVAVGASASSLGRVAGAWLDDAALRDALAMLTAEPAAVVAPRVGIDPRRVRLLPAGLLILQGFVRRLGGAVSVGRGGIREGVLLEAGAA